MSSMALRNPLDNAIGKIDELLALLSAKPATGNASTYTAPPAVPSIPAQPSPVKPQARLHAASATDKEPPQQQWLQQPKKEKKAPKAPAASSVPATSGDGLFYRAQLQVVRISTVEDTESDKLLKTSIDVGNGESRQVVAGLKMHIPAAELQGRLAVAILNLKPAKLAGMTSEAMLLAADAPKGDGDELVRILTPSEGSEVGDKVFLEGGAAPTEYAKTLKSDPWRSIVENLSVQAGKAVYESTPLVTAKGPITLASEMPDGASIH